MAKLYRTFSHTASTDSGRLAQYGAIWTANHWLQNMDARKDEIMPDLERTYGKKNVAVWFQRWKIFFMACAELWGFRKGRESRAAHYLFRKRRVKTEIVTNNRLQS